MKAVPSATCILNKYIVFIFEKNITEGTFCMKPAIAERKIYCEKEYSAMVMRGVAAFGGEYAPSQESPHPPPLDTLKEPPGISD